MVGMGGDKKSDTLWKGRESAIGKKTNIIYNHKSEIILSELFCCYFFINYNVFYDSTIHA